MMQVRAMDMAVREPIRRALPVQALLEWAFADECAQLDFDEEAGRAYDRLAVDPIWRMMRQAELGCRIDGGRHVGLEPRRAEDAELIAAVVARLPVAHGGRSMAVRVVELARARSAPDWMEGARPRVEPVTWRKNRHGWHAGSEVAATEWITTRHGRVRPYEVRYCPVVVRPTAQQIAAARRGYLDWWGALLYLRADLAHAGLQRHAVSKVMPPMTPWRLDGETETKRSA